MKDEIKEILENIKKQNEWKGIEYFRTPLSNENVDKLLDYITNLQEENERLSKNQRYYKNGVFCLEYDKETMSDMIDDYKSRIDKAIEYIVTNREPVDEKDGEVLFWLSDEFDEEDLLKILKGEENESN